jgi:hypothetical protein
MLTTDSFTLPAGRSLRSLSPSARWTGRSAFPRCTSWADRLSSHFTASPLGEEEPGPEGAERGGYLPIPRRDARAGMRVPGDAPAEPDWPQRPERPQGSESLSVTGTGNSNELSVKQSARSGVVQPVMRSLRRNHGRLLANNPERETRETVRAERSGSEHGRPTIITKNRGTAMTYLVTERGEVVVLKSLNFRILLTGYKSNYWIAYCDSFNGIL